MKVCAFGHHHKMHKKLKHKGRHGCHNGLKACEGPFEQGKCHFKKGKEFKKNKHNHGHKGHCHDQGHKRHGPKQLCLHPHGGKYFGLSSQAPCEGNRHGGHGGPHRGHGGPQRGHGGPHRGHGGPHRGDRGPHHGYGEPHHGHGGQFHGRGGCGRDDFHKDHHGKHHEQGEKRNKHQCQCFSQDETGPQEPSRCFERPRSV